VSGLFEKNFFFFNFKKIFLNFSKAKKKGLKFHAEAVLGVAWMPSTTALLLFPNQFEGLQH